MEQENLDILKNIKPVEVSDLLYDKIARRIEMSRARIIPLYKAGIAASLALGFVVTQFVVLHNFSENKSSTSQKVELIQITDNSLYHE